MEPSAPSGEVLQLRAVLRGISPLIWRRLLVHRNTSIAHLHHILQVAFGWEDVHLHRFEIRGRAYGIPLGRDAAGDRLRAKVTVPTDGWEGTWDGHRISRASAGGAVRVPLRFSANRTPGCRALNRRPSVSSISSMSL